MIANEPMSDERLAWIGEWVEGVTPQQDYYDSMRRFMLELLDEVKRARAVEANRAGLDVEYTVGDGIEPYRSATFTNAEAARHSRDLHHDKDGQIMRRLVGDWEVLPDDE